MAKLIKRIRQWIPEDEQFSFFSLGPSPLFRRLWFYVWDYPFTPPGKVFLAGGFILSGLVGAVTVESPVSRLCMAILLVGLCASTLGSFLRWRRVTISGRFPERVRVGEPTIAECTLNSQGGAPFPMYDVSVWVFNPPEGWETADRPDFIPHLPPRRPTTMRVTLVPHRRGLYRLPPIRAYTTFPFNFGRNELARCSGGSVLVLPQFHPLARVDLEIGSRYQPGGIALTSRIGESPEYIGNRDYMPGDSLRRIDFRSWGRLAKPVVREYQEEYYCRIALVLDTHIPPRRRPERSGFPEFEAAVSLSAALADALARGEFLIDIFAAGPELHVFRAGRSIAHFENVLDILAAVAPCRTDPFEKIAPALAQEWNSVSAAVCVSLDWDESRQQLVRSAQESGCRVKAIIVRDRPTTLPLGADEGTDLILLSPAPIAAGQVDVV
jgi:uncharacterized protein (DUF58 family)